LINLNSFVSKDTFGFPTDLTDGIKKVEPKTTINLSLAFGCILLLVVHHDIYLPC